MNNLCGCRPELLSSRTVEENFADCRICGIKTTCPYPREALLKMAKSAIEEDSSENLQDLARQSASFSAFHEKTTRKQDKLDREPSNDHNFSFHEHVEKQEPQFRRPNKNVNLQALARESLYFGEFHAKTQTQDE